MDKSLPPIIDVKSDNVKLSNREVIQSYLLTSARYSFNVHEKRILTSLVANLQYLLEGKHLQGRLEKDLFNYSHIVAPISMFTIPSESYNHVWDAFKSLNDKVIHYTDDVTNRKQICRIIEMPSYYYKRGFVEFTLQPILVDVFLNMSSGYSKFELSVSLNFRSVYSMRLYELLASQEFPISYSIDKLREMFCLLGKYSLNADFIRYVISPAKKDLDISSPVTFDYELQKTGKEITSILFIPYKNDKYVDDSIVDSDLKRQINVSQFVFDPDIRYFLKHTCNYTDRELKNNSSLFEKVFSKYQSKLIMNDLPHIWERALKSENPKGYLFGYFKNLANQ